MRKDFSYIKLVIAILIFGTLGIYRKFMPLSSASIAFWRGVIGIIFLLCAMKFKFRKGYINRKNFLNLNLKNFLILFLGGIFLGVNWLFLFEGYNKSSVSLVTLCCYMQPIFVIILSSILFNEKLTRKKILCFIAALIGMILISGVIESGLPSKDDLAGMLCGLCSGFFYALLVICNKFVKGVDAYIKTIIQLTASSCAVLPYIILNNSFALDVWNLNSLSLMLIVGIINTGVGYALYFSSMDKLKAQTIAITGYLDPVTALILAALILGERLSIYGVIGAVLILGAALTCELGDK